MAVVESNYGTQYHRTIAEHPVTFCGLPPDRTHPADSRWQDVDEPLRCVRCSAMDPRLVALWRVLEKSGTLVEARAAEIGMRARAARVARRKARGGPRRPTW